MAELKYSRLDLAMNTFEYYLDRYIIKGFDIKKYSYKIKDSENSLIPKNNDEVYTFLDKIVKNKVFADDRRPSFSVDLKKDDLTKKLILKKTFDYYYFNID